MRARPHRSASVIAIAALASVASPAAADPPAEAALTIQCERVAEPGRVKCGVDLRAAEGHTVAWADVVILEVPAFTTALKGRLGPSDVTAHDPGASRWAFGLVARKAGQGEARVRVRAVVCDAKGRCVPVAIDARGTVHVG